MDIDAEAAHGHQGNICRAGFVENKKSKNVSDVTSEHGCWGRKRYDKVFFFIIDALRLDFMTQKRDSFSFENVNAHKRKATNSSQTSANEDRDEDRISAGTTHNLVYNRLTTIHKLLVKNRWL